MTQTEKKYKSRLGRLYWSSEREWNREKEQYDIRYFLVMLSGCAKKYGESGKYRYSIDVLTEGRTYDKNTQYFIDCSYFIKLENKINRWDNGYFPVITGDAEKDVAQIPKEC